MADMNEKAKLHRGTVKGLLYADDSALPPLRAREEIAGDAKAELDRFVAFVLHNYNAASQQGRQEGFEASLALARNKLRDAILSRTAGQEWREISSDQPPNREDVLVWWPFCKLDAEGNLTDEQVGGQRCIAKRDGEHWEDYGALDGIGSYYMDDHEPARKPSLWQLLSAPPLAEPKETP